MNDAGTRTSRTLLLKRYAWGLAAGWTLVASALIGLNVRHEWRQATETALTQARSIVQRDIIFRHWNVKYGPIYVRVDKGILPNPYLADSPDRDVTTTGGDVLTQVNAAYMTRLVFELAAQHYGVRGHITSLRPVRPENRPDAWESASLRAFEKGREEASSIEAMNGAFYLRLMKPLIMDQDCLSCHRKHGYRAGDIGGGISVAVPMEPLNRIARQNIVVNILSFTVLWIGGLGSIMFGAGRLKRAIEQRETAEREVAALNKQLLSQKEEVEAVNRELEAFAATVSHDLRSPLSTIGGFARLIKELPEEKLGEKRVNYADIISHEAERMETLIRALLDFSRLSKTSLKREPVDLSRVAAEIAVELKQSDPDRTVTFTIESGAAVTGDAVLLRAVMHNLLANAWKFTGRQKEALIEFGVMKRSGEEIFFVRDNGAGFDNEQAGRIFEAFQRLHSNKEFKGTGIGLATVKRIITRHGGRVWAEGEKGKGAAFYFTIP
jgi:signal transduction histidine kinase